MDSGNPPSGAPTPPPPEPPTPATTADPSPPRTPSWQWFAVAIGTVLVVAAVVIAATQLGGDDDEPTAGGSGAPEVTGADPPTDQTTPAITGSLDGTAPSDPSATDGASVPDASTAPTGEAPADAEGVGHAFELPGGALVRVNSVVPNAPEPEGVFAPPEGVSLTRLEVEGCGGDQGLSMAGESWTGFLDDLQGAELFTSASNAVDITPSQDGCVRFTLAYAVPDGRFLKNLVFNVGGDELSRWELTFGSAPTEPLVGEGEPAAAVTGETVDLDNSSTVVLRSVEPNAVATDAASTAADGYQYVVVDGQVCAGTVAVRVHPFNWMVVATDNRVGTNIFAPSTFPATELAPGQCGWGTVHLLLPAEAVPAYVIFTDGTGAELGRWAVGS